MIFNLSDLFFVVVIFQLLFISFFLFSHDKGRRISNYLLGIFFLSICLNLIDSFFQLKRVYFSAPSFAFWGGCIPLLFGPLLYLYVQSVLLKDFRLNRQQGYHLLPFVLLFLIGEAYYLFQPKEKQLALLENLFARKVPVVLYWTSGFIFIQFLAYCIAALRLIKRYEISASEKFSDQQRNNLSWLSYTLVFFMVLMLVSVLNGFLAMTALAQYFYLIFAILLLLLLLFINRILLKALKRPEIFAVMEEKVETRTGSGTPKYAGSGLSVDDKNRILGDLSLYMDVQRPWLEPELTLEQLAGQLSLRPKVLSQVINESLQQNFFDFINRYRIEEAKRLLTNPSDKKITILEVLYEVGFNSKSSFNTLFKKNTGMTPSEFKKKKPSVNPLNRNHS